jgi:hypothetical protein
LDKRRRLTYASRTLGLADKAEDALAGVSIDYSRLADRAQWTAYQLSFL